MVRSVIVGLVLCLAVVALAGPPLLRTAAPVDVVPPGVREYTAELIGVADGMVCNDAGGAAGTRYAGFWVWTEETGKVNIGTPEVGSDYPQMRGFNNAGELLVSVNGPRSGTWGHVYRDGVWSPLNMRGKWLGGITDTGIVWGRVPGYRDWSAPHMHGYWAFTLDLDSGEYWEPDPPLTWSHNWPYQAAASPDGVIAVNPLDIEQGWYHYNRDWCVYSHRVEPVYVSPPDERLAPFAATNAGSVALYTTADNGVPESMRIVIWDGSGYVAEIESGIGEGLRAHDMSESRLVLYSQDVLPDVGDEEPASYVPYVYDVDAGVGWRVVCSTLDLADCTVCGIDTAGDVFVLVGDTAYRLTPND